VKVKLRQLPDGRWYKFGVGKPAEATAEEVSLWQSAQEELADEIGRPKSTWSRVIDLAKWGTLLIATITFLVLLATG